MNSILGLIVLLMDSGSNKGNSDREIGQIDVYKAELNDSK